jgi:cation diffusion facilitator family transporter
MAHGSTGVVIRALAANLGIAIAKFIAAVISRSAAMLAEAVHSLADSGNQILLLVGMRQGRKGEDTDHEFGHGPEAYFWEFIVAVCLFTIGATFSIYEGVSKVLNRQAHEMGSATLAYVVLGVSIGLELYSFKAAKDEFSEMRGGRPLRRAFDELRDAAVMVVLFEDLAALFGLLTALAGIVLSHLTGDVMWDGIASIIVGLVLGSVAYLVARKTKHLLIGQAVPPSQRRRIVELAQSSPGVRKVIHLRTMHLGPEDVICAMKCAFDDDAHATDVAKYIDVLEARLRAEMPQLRRIYIEVGTAVVHAVGVAEGTEGTP